MSSGNAGDAETVGVLPGHLDDTELVRTQALNAGRLILQWRNVLLYAICFEMHLISSDQLVQPCRAFCAHRGLALGRLGNPDCRVLCIDK